VRRLGGSDGNEQLTAIVATLLIVGLAIEGATLLDLTRFLTVHAFLGMVLVPVVALKLGSVVWRMARYYLGANEYVRRGPPHPFLRLILSPIAVASTILLFGTGIALLALDRIQGTVAALHKASFVVWLGSVGLHVLVRLVRLPDALRLRVPGLTLRVGIAATAVVTGVAVATATLPAADHLQDRMSAVVGVDAA
jgi:hypothetical protein